jgi:hypothetical protein
MYKNLVINYVKNMNIEDMNSFVKNNNISISEKDKMTIYNYIKKHYETFFDNPIDHIKMLKGKIEDNIYYEVLGIYDKYKNLL